LLNIVIIIKQHHFFVLILTLSTISVASRTIFLELLELICVCCANELAIHVEDLTLGIHEELSVVTFYLYSSHYNVIFHVDAYLLIVSSLTAITICFSRLTISVEFFSISSKGSLRVVILYELLLRLKIIVVRIRIVKTCVILLIIKVVYCLLFLVTIVAILDSFIAHYWSVSVDWHSVMHGCDSVSGRHLLFLTTIHEVLIDLVGLID
jgi:hypothetical protein